MEGCPSETIKDESLPSVVFMQERAHKLAEAVYRLEVEKRKLQHIIAASQNQENMATWQKELASLRERFDQQAALLSDSQRRLRIATGKRLR